MQDWIEARIQELEERQFPVGPQIRETGISWAIVQDGRITDIGARGWRDRGARIPVTTETVFPIASITKSFTAALLVQALERRGISLEAPIAPYLPGFRLGPMTEHISSVDLLAHRCGLPRHDALWYRAHLSSDEMLERLSRLELNPPDGSGFRNSFQYNNLLYGVAGRVFERLTDRSWADAIEQDFLRPLKMSRSLAIGKPAGDIARPHFRETRCSEFGHWSCPPAGSMHATATDVARWIEFQIDHAATFQSSLWKEWNLADGAPESGSCVGRAGYGLGWFVDDFAGERFIHHGGSINGFSTSAAFLPDRRVGFVILCNQVQSRLPKALTSQVLLRLIGTRAAPEDRYRPASPYSEKTLMPIFSGPIDLSSEDRTRRAAMTAAVRERRLRRILSRPARSHPGYGTLRISEGTPNLHLRLESGDPWPTWLVAEDELIARVDWLGMPCRMRIPISRDGDGQETLHVPLNLHPGCEPTPFRSMIRP